MRESIVIFDYAPLMPAYDDIEKGLRLRDFEVVRAPPIAIAQDSAAVLDAAVWLIGHNATFGPSELRKARKLRGIATYGIGTDMLDVATATELGIRIGVGAVSENVTSMAEATVMLMLNLFYDLKGTESLLRSQGVRPTQMTARTLSRRRVGLIGYGRIAQAVGARLAPFGCDVVVATRREVPSGGPLKVTLDELLSTSDVVSVHLELNDQTRGALGDHELRRMRKGAFLLNVSRGGIVDEQVVADMALSGHLAGIAFDTFSQEPLPIESKLRDIPGAILTPHMVGHTKDSIESLTRAAIENIARMALNQAPLHLCNPDVETRLRSG